MFHACCIVMNEIIHDDITVINYKEIEKRGFQPLFEEHSLMYLHQGRWYATNEFAVTLIHVKQDITGLRGGIPFERLSVDPDKVYEFGKIILENNYEANGIPLVWPRLSQFVFYNSEGLFITSDVKLQYIQYPREEPYIERKFGRMARGVRSARG